jgi:iron complex outermembrane receptor protein
VLRANAITTALRLAFAGGVAACAAQAHAQTASELSELSIEELANVPVTTVSRRAESLAQAPAATYVITHEQIVRSGAQTLPEILRLAPNLTVVQTSASSWQIGARGLIGSLPAQNFSNKLLVLIDGRSVYTPLFSGVYWDLQDVLPEDIERIEVISGPAGTLWGANAVNGVVNIITRGAEQTRGGFASGEGGPHESAVGLRYGAALGATASWRAYLHANHRGDSLTATGASANDDWSRLQGGFRLDWAPRATDAVSLHGDILTGRGKVSGEIDGGNLVARWTHAYADGSTLQVQGFVDREQRGRDTGGGVPLGVTTLDLDVQQGMRLGRHELVLGGDVRSARYRISNTGGLAFEPATGTLDLGSVYAQDTVSLASTVRLILGLKMEHDPYAGWSVMPNARLAWSPGAGALVWAAASRAVRSPTPFDVDVQERVGGVLFLHGDPEFRTEKLTAYELGVRLQPIDRLSFSVNGYYNVYDDLRSIELTAGKLPLLWGNKLGGYTYGVESWANLQVLDWWRVGASVNLISEHFKFDAGSSRLLGVSQIGDDPRFQGKLTSSLTLGPFSWDAELRRQCALPAPHVSAYTELNSRLAWALNDRLELSVTGFNLLHRQHQEFMAPQATAVRRSVVGGLRWRF